MRTSNNVAKATVITHDGVFHADEVLASAVLSLLHDKNIRFIRTRDRATIIKNKGFAYILDVGSVHDPDNWMFDHHQRIGKPEGRSNGTPYATAGLVWRTFGDALVKKIAPELNPEDVCAIVASVDRDFFEFVDMHDEGIFTHSHGATFSSLIAGFNPVWNQSEGGQTADALFEEAVCFAERILLNKVRSFIASKQAAMHIQQAAQEQTGEILVLERFCPAVDVPVHVKFLVYPDVSSPTDWAATAIRQSGAPKCPFPENWGGLSGQALEKASGIEGAVFCHAGRFIAVGASKDVILTMVQEAIRLSQ